MNYLPDNAKQLADIIETKKPFRLSATVYEKMSQSFLVIPKHCFETSPGKRNEVIESMFEQLQDKAKGLTFDRTISYMSGNQHVLQFNFTV